MQGVHLRKYGVATIIDFDLYEVDGINLKINAPFGGGDSRIMQDEGGEVTTDNLPVDRGQGYSITLSITEMAAARIVVYIVDITATKVFLDKVLVIETYGHTGAQHGFDLDLALQSANVIQWNSTAVSADTAGQPNVNMKWLNDNVTAAVNLALSALGIIPGTTSTGTTTTSIVTDLGTPGLDLYKDSLLIFTSGPAAGERTNITGSSTIGTLTVSTLDVTPTPGGGDTFVIV